MVARETILKASESIVNILQSYNITEADDMRKVLGLTLSSVHSTVIASCKTEEEFASAKLMVKDTVEKILGSAATISKDCGRTFEL